METSDVVLSIAIVAAPILAGAAAIAFALTGYRAAHRALREWDEVDGEITGKSGRGSNTRFKHFRWTDASGTVHEGRERWAAGGFGGLGGYPYDDTLYVDPADPTRALSRGTVRALRTNTVVASLIGVVFVGVGLWMVSVAFSSFPG